MTGQVTFGDYFVILQRRWRVWGSGVVLGMLAAVTFSALAPVMYTATATSFVTVPDGEDSGQGDMFQGSQFVVQRVKSYASLSASPDVLKPVIADLGLEMTTSELRRAITVSSPPETALLEIAVTDPSSSRSAAIANAVSVEMGRIIEGLETPRGTDNATVRVTLTQPANPPVKPSSPRTLLNVLLATMGGLALGFVAALVRHHRDRRIKSAEPIHVLTGMSPLGSTLYEKDAAKRPLVALDSRSVSAERFRSIRTALKFASVDHGLRHFVVSSPLAGVGKTTVACNLAISWAQTGASVCLVEADLRRPSVARLLGLDGSVGLTDVLLDEAKLDEVLIPWHHNSLTVLSAGSLPPDPAALLGSSAMQDLVSTLREQFDVVIYDSPPLLSVTDAAVLSEALDGMVLVVRWGQTSRDDLGTTIDMIRRDRLHLLGTILSGVRTRGKAENAYF